MIGHEGNAPTPLLRARTSAEARAHLSRLRCPCSGTYPAWDSSVVELDDVLGARYEADCADCGTHRAELFTLTDQPVDVRAPGAMFGVLAGPSELLDAVAWHTLADNEAASAADDPEQRHQHLRVALAAICEVRALVEPQTGQVPRESLHDEQARTAYDRDPGAYLDDRLAAVQAEYRRLLDEC